MERRLDELDRQVPCKPRPVGGELHIGDIIIDGKVFKDDEVIIAQGDQMKVRR